MADRMLEGPVLFRYRIPDHPLEKVDIEPGCPMVLVHDVNHMPRHRWKKHLGEQIRRCILMLESKWEQKKLSLSVYVQDIRCLGNEELLSQVWLNLLDNALKFTPEGGKIDVTLGLENGWAKVVLRDNGAGISADSAAHIFDKFYHADTSHAMAGNGLGLTLAKRLSICMEVVSNAKASLGKAQNSWFAVFFQNSVSQLHSTRDLQTLSPFLLFSICATYYQNEL